MCITVVVRKELVLYSSEPNTLMSMALAQVECTVSEGGVSRPELTVT